MAEVMTLAYVAGGVLLVIVAYLLIRLYRATEHRGRKRWVDRSRRDRRQRVGYLRPERRKRDRREEDVAKHYLDRLNK
ncbi:MAG: hypothetical protein LJE95_12570 [Acidobacteria bacterium]|jgi:hypothetical protein|nr:hypothetical protein [Acidobacteriota bacterium]